MADGEQGGIMIPLLLIANGTTSRPLRAALTLRDSGSRMQEDGGLGSGRGWPLAVLWDTLLGPGTIIGIPLVAGPAGAYSGAAAARRGIMEVELGRGALKDSTRVLDMAGLAGDDLIKAVRIKMCSSGTGIW